MVKYLAVIAVVGLFVAVIAQGAPQAAPAPVAPSSPPDAHVGAEACDHIRTNLKPATIFALILVIFAFLVEILIYTVNYFLKEKEQLLMIMRKIFDEVMLLGLIGILILAFHQSQVTQIISEKMAKWGVQNPFNPLQILPCAPNQLVAVFEKVHLGIVGTMGIYFATCLWLVIWHWLIYHVWERFDFVPFDSDAYQGLLHDFRSDSIFVRYLKIPRLFKLWRLRSIDRLHALRASCIVQYGLPQDFQFSWYFKLAMRDVVIQVLTVNPLCWLLLIVVFGFQLVRMALFRVDHSETTIIMYGCVSLLLALIAGAVYFVASRIYIQVLNLSSVKKYLKISVQTMAGDFEFPRSDDDFEEQSYADDVIPASLNLRRGDASAASRAKLGEKESLLRSPTSSHSNYGVLRQPSSSSIPEALDSDSAHSSHSSLFGPVKGEDKEGVLLDSFASTNHSGPIPTSYEFKSPRDFGADAVQQSFQDTTGGRQMVFNIFSRPSVGTVSLMTVDEYREKSTLVSNILRRAQMRTSDDTAHENMFFFKSRRFLVSALQFLIFIQSWVLGLSIYYSWSIYRDKPTDIPKHGGIIVFPFIGPLITYAIMGVTLEKLVKSSYVAGLTRPDLIIETLFSTPSSFNTAALPPDAVSSWNRVNTIISSRRTMEPA